MDFQVTSSCSCTKMTVRPTVRHLSSCWQRYIVQLYTTSMPNIPKPKRHLLHFQYVPNYLCTQYPVFPSYLTPCFILKTDESSKGTWKSELSMLHSNYNRSSYNSKTDPVRNEKWNVNYLCKHLSITFHFPFPRCNRATDDEGPWPRTHQKALTTTRPEHSNLAENCTLWPHSNTRAKALAA